MSSTNGRHAALPILVMLTRACQPGRPLVATPDPDADGTLVGHVWRAPGRMAVPDRPVVARDAADHLDFVVRSSLAGSGRGHP